MRQSRFSLLGGLLVVVPLAFAAAFGWRAVFEAPEMLVYGFAGVIAVVGARVAAVEVGRVRVSWRVLVGGSWLLVALANVVDGLTAVLDGAGSAAVLVSTGGLLVASCCIAFVGFEVARDGRHVEVTADVERVLAL
jgi:hypothetical protein